MLALWSYTNKSPRPGQELGCKGPRVGANFWCKSPGVRGGMVMDKIDTCLKQARDCCPPLSIRILMGHYPHAKEHGTAILVFRLLFPLCSSLNVTIKFDRVATTGANKILDFCNYRANSVGPLPHKRIMQKTAVLPSY